MKIFPFPGLFWVLGGALSPWSTEGDLLVFSFDGFAMCLLSKVVLDDLSSTGTGLLH